MTELLFSYGTLRQRGVQLTTFGRELDGRDDAIVGYELDHVTITDPHVIATSGSDRHPILRPTDRPGAEIRGTVFTISEAELAAADERLREERQVLRTGRYQDFNVHVAAISPSCCVTTFPSIAMSQCGFAVPL